MFKMTLSKINLIQYYFATNYFISVSICGVLKYVHGSLDSKIPVEMMTAKNVYDAWHLLMLLLL